MKQITIDGNPYNVYTELTDGKVIAGIEGVFAYAWQNGNVWEWWAGSPSLEDSAALKKVIDENGGFDNTTINIVPPT